MRVSILHGHPYADPCLLLIAVRTTEGFSFTIDGAMRGGCEYFIYNFKINVDSASPDFILINNQRHTTDEEYVY